MRRRMTDQELKEARYYWAFLSVSGRNTKAIAPCIRSFNHMQWYAETLDPMQTLIWIINTMGAGNGNSNRNT